MAKPFVSRFKGREFASRMFCLVQFVSDFSGNRRTSYGDRAACDAMDRWLAITRREMGPFGLRPGVI